MNRFRVTVSEDIEKTEEVLAYLKKYEKVLNETYEHFYMQFLTFGVWPESGEFQKFIQERFNSVTKKPEEINLYGRSPDTIYIDEFGVSDTSVPVKLGNEPPLDPNVTCKRYKPGKNHCDPSTRKYKAKDPKRMYGYKHNHRRK